MSRGSPQAEVRIHSESTSTGMGRRLFNASITPQPQVIPWVLAITLGLCWAAVLLPLRRALAVRPATALRG